MNASSKQPIIHLKRSDLVLLSTNIVSNDLSFHLPVCEWWKAGAFDR
jgi:hypothetical protein